MVRVFHSFTAISGINHRVKSAKHPHDKELHKFWALPGFSILNKATRHKR